MAEMQPPSSELPKTAEQAVGVFNETVEELLQDIREQGLGKLNLVATLGAVRDSALAIIEEIKVRHGVEEKPNRSVRAAIELVGVEEISNATSDIITTLDSLNNLQLSELLAAMTRVEIKARGIALPPEVSDALGVFTTEIKKIKSLDVSSDYDDPSHINARIQRNGLTDTMASIVDIIDGKEAGRDSNIYIPPDEVDEASGVLALALLRGDMSDAGKLLLKAYLEELQDLARTV